jgi:hypothetical protein
LFSLTILSAYAAVGKAAASMWAEAQDHEQYEEKK